MKCEDANWIHLVQVMGCNARIFVMLKMKKVRVNVRPIYKRTAIRLDTSRAKLHGSVGQDAGCTIDFRHRGFSLWLP